MDNIETMPVDIMLQEKQSRRDRILMEVMQKLFSMLPDTESCECPCFTLESGHKCWIRKFSEPFERDGELQYGFDIIIENGLGIDHIEFTVKSTGFGGMSI